MNSPKTVKIARLLNEAVVLNQLACKEIRQAHVLGKTKAFDKSGRTPLVSSSLGPKSTNISFSDVVTETDIKCQHIISSNLEALYPKAKLVGEEDSLMKDYETRNDARDTFNPDQVQLMA